MRQRISPGEQFRRGNALQPIVWKAISESAIRNRRISDHQEKREACPVKPQSSNSPGL